MVKEPPLLPPDLSDRLPKRLKRMHTDLLQRCGMDLSTYQQLAAGRGAQGTANQYKESKMLEEMWRGIKSALSREMTQTNFRTYIKDTQALAFDRNLGILIIQTPNPLTSQILGQQFATVIVRTLREANAAIDGVPVYDVRFQSKR